MFPNAIILLTISVLASSTPDYYWRPFDGTIPTDAIIAYNGSRKYFIGNVPVWEGGTYVGKLSEGQKQIIVTGDPKDENPTGVHIIDDNIQILCTRDPELFEWIPTTSETIDTIPYLLVQGGYERKQFYPLYIGRTFNSGYFVLGKIISKLEPDDEGIYTYKLCAYDQVENHEGVFSSYDVLVYKGLKKRT